MTQLTLEDVLEDHNDTVNIGGRTGCTRRHNDAVNIGGRTTTMTQLEDHNDTVNIGGRTRRPHRHS